MSELNMRPLAEKIAREVRTFARKHHQFEDGCGFLDWTGQLPGVNKCGRCGLVFRFTTEDAEGWLRTLIRPKKNDAKDRMLHAQEMAELGDPNAEAAIGRAPGKLSKHPLDCDCLDCIAELSGIIEAFENVEREPEFRPEPNGKGDRLVGLFEP